MAAYLDCFETISSREWSLCFSVGQGWILSEQTFGTSSFFFHKNTEWDWAPVGGWMAFIVIGMWSGKVWTGSAAGGSGGREGGGGRTLLLLFLSWVSAVFNNTLGFAFSAAGSFSLTGPWCFGAERLEGRLILKPSTSRLTPTYCGTSTAA